jgi:putative transposase
MESGSVKTIRLPARSPNLNSFAERWVRSVKEECLSKLILFGERSLRRALQQYVVHYHEERNHQGKENLILFPLKREGARDIPTRILTLVGSHLCPVVDQEFAFGHLSGDPTRHPVKTIWSTATSQNGSGPF